MMNTFCRNEACRYYKKTHDGNVKFKSKQTKTLYCKACGKSWSLSSGSFLYNLKTPTKVILRCLLSVSTGKPLRKTAREERVTTDSIFAWISRANQYFPEVCSLLEDELSANRKELKQFSVFLKKDLNAISKAKQN